MAKDVLVTMTNYKPGDRVVMSGKNSLCNNYTTPDDVGTISDKPHVVNNCLLVDWDSKVSVRGARAGYNNMYDLKFYTKEMTPSLLNRIGHLL